MAKLILCLSKQHMIASLWQGGDLKFYRVFANHSEEQADFRDFIQAYAQIKTYIIADTIDEEYRQETIAHTNGRDRVALLQRKLQQFYPQHIFRAAHLIKAKTKSQNTRRNDNVLFVGVGQADYIQVWLELLQQHNVVGVYLLPMISLFLQHQQYVESSHFLLCEQLSSGFRLSYFSEGDLCLSRLLPIIGQQPANVYWQEVEKTRLYLHRQRMLVNHSDLLLLWRGRNANHMATAHQLDVDCKVSALTAYKTSSSLSSAMLEQYPELAHMQCLALGHTPVNLAPKSLTQNYHYKQVRKLIDVSTCVVSVLGLLVSAYLLWLANYDAAKVAQQQKQIKQLSLASQTEVPNTTPSNELNASNKLNVSELKARNIKPTDIKFIVQLAQNINQLSEASPQTLMLLLSNALTSLPEISIHGLYWQHSPSTTISSTTIDDKLNDSAPMLKLQDYQSAWRPSVLLSLHVENAPDDNAALNSINQLAGLLQLNSAIEQVNLQEKEMTVSNALHGHMSADYEKPTTAYKLQLILKSTNANAVKHNAL